jgi:hypothetical protein
MTNERERQRLGRFLIGWIAACMSLVIIVTVAFDVTASKLRAKPRMSHEDIIKAVRSCDTNGLPIRIGTNTNDRPVSYSCGSLSEKERDNE